MEWPDREGWFRLLVTFVSLAVYLALIEPLGVAMASSPLLNFPHLVS